MTLSKGQVKAVHARKKHKKALYWAQYGERTNTAMLLQNDLNEWHRCLGAMNLRQDLVTQHINLYERENRSIEIQKSTCWAEIARIEAALKVLEKS